MRSREPVGVITPPSSRVTDGVPSYGGTLAHLLPPPVVAYHRKEITHGLRRLAASSALYWNAMPDEEFVAPLGAAWSPAQHVRHLTRSVRAVSRALAVPRWLLRLLFHGRQRGLSRRYELVVARYQEALRNGGQAGRYAPPHELVPGDPAEYRREVLDRHHAAVERLASQVSRWTRREVDNILLPHPLLGMLTVREMLLFTLYHNHHHVLAVARRRGEYFSESTPLNGG